MASEPLRVLVVGGYGVFGGRLIRLLANEDKLTLLVAGRSISRAEAFCRAVNGRATILPQLFDRDANLALLLESVRPDVVVDASGPFQTYGDNPYRVVQACLAHGVDYIDLSDATDFVCGISEFESSARACDRFVISGASTCPALTAAVIRRLAVDLTSVVAVEAGIAPSPRVQVGLSVISALTSYAGHTLQLLREGNQMRSVAFVDSRRHVISLGTRSLNERVFSLVDVPDLKLLPLAWSDLKSVWLGAGLSPVIQHRMFVLLAWLSSVGVLRSLTRWASFLHWMRRLPTRGEDRGGMYVAVDGLRADGALVRREWDLIAEADDGPFIPAMAAAAIIRRCQSGQRPRRGARPALSELEYGDFEYFFRQKKISARVQDLPSRDGLPQNVASLGF